MHYKRMRMPYGHPHSEPYPELQLFQQSLCGSFYIFSGEYCRYYGDTCLSAVLYLMDVFMADTADGNCWYLHTVTYLPELFGSDTHCVLLCGRRENCSHAQIISTFGLGKLSLFNSFSGSADYEVFACDSADLLYGSVLDAVRRGSYR